MKIFNTNADCSPELHYMVNIQPKLCAIKKMVDKGQYFTMNRARQYGKTTTLQALERFLQNDYLVISLDFQMLSSADFESERAFVEAFSQELLDAVQNPNLFPADIAGQLAAFADGREPARLSRLFRCLSHWCETAGRKIVLMVDGVDHAANCQVFLDFLSQLRGYYIQRKKKPAFHSVILAGVCDIRNMKRKITSNRTHSGVSPQNIAVDRDSTQNIAADRNDAANSWNIAADSSYGVNSLWNIAVDFLVDMSFSQDDIAGMLREYERDHRTGMDPDEMAGLLYDYTSGYPFLVSQLCKYMDEQIPAGLDSAGFAIGQGNAWTKEGVKESVKILLSEKIRCSSH